MLNPLLGESGGKNMRSILAFICFSALLASSQASAAQVRCSGSFVFQSGTAGCTDWNPTGERGFARFRPQIEGVPDNGNSSRIGLFFQDGAMGWQLNNGL